WLSDGSPSSSFFLLESVLSRALGDLSRFIPCNVTMGEASGDMLFSWRRTDGGHHTAPEDHLLVLDCYMVYKRHLCNLTCCQGIASLTRGCLAVRSSSSPGGRGRLLVLHLGLFRGGTPLGEGVVLSRLEVRDGSLSRPWFSEPTVVSGGEGWFSERTVVSSTFNAASRRALVSLAWDGSKLSAVWMSWRMKLAKLSPSAFGSTFLTCKTQANKTHK
ncbi:hypothetical protein J4Q44_G00294190, partial [Coregonus suidteri]